MMAYNELHKSNLVESAMKSCSKVSSSSNLNSNTVALRWSAVLKSAFDYYYSDYIPVWTLNETKFNNSGDMILMRKKGKEWLNWEKINILERPDTATLFELLPDLPDDNSFWKLVKDLKRKGIKNPVDHFWENIFSYRPAKQVKVNGRNYTIEWEA